MAKKQEVDPRIESRRIKQREYARARRADPVLRAKDLERQRERDRERYQNDPDYRNARLARSRKNAKQRYDNDQEYRRKQIDKRNPEYQRKYQRAYGQRSYLWPVGETTQTMQNAQKNCCRICRKPFVGTPHVDHCHKSNKVRGLLCAKCNQGLGLFDDSLSHLGSAFEYLLEAHNDRREFERRRTT